MGELQCTLAPCQVPAVHTLSLTLTCVSLCSGPTCCTAPHPSCAPPHHTPTHIHPHPHPRQRYLDLIVSDEVRSTFRARSKIISALRRHLEDAGFLEVRGVMQRCVGGLVCAGACLKLMHA